jgi:AmmeMemoRadiSam system protein B
LHPDGFALVPVLLGGGASREEAKRVAGRVGALADAATCFVISSDFTHYGARFGYTPFTTRVPERIRELDLGAVAAIEAGDATGFSRYVDATGATICGARAIDVLLLSPVGRDGAKLVAYDTSGRMTGRWDHSVSYAGIVFP